VTKADVVTEIATKTGIERVAVQEVVESFFDVLKDNMSKGENVYFRGFGSFILKNRARKIARNIAKNTSIVIEPHAIPAFKPAKTFVEDVKGKVQAAKKKVKKAKAKA
jgi:DNA-binding protein HU-beta